MNPLIEIILTSFVRAVLGSEFFVRIEASVHRWAEREVEAIENEKGVLSVGSARRRFVLLELEELGIHGAEWAVRTAIELAVGKLQNFENPTKLP